MKNPYSVKNKDYPEAYPCGHLFINSCRRCLQPLSNIKIKEKMKTIHRIVKPQSKRLLVGSTITFHPTLLLIQAFDENGQRVWYSQEKVGNSTVSKALPVEWDISNIDPNLVGVWQAARGNLTLPEGVQLHKDVRVIIPILFVESFTAPYPDVPDSMLPIPLNINTATREEIMTLPLGGGMRTQNKRADLIMKNQPFAQVDDLEDLIGKVALINCKYVGITTEDVVIEPEQPLVTEVLEELNGFAHKLENIEEVKGVGKIVKERILEYFNK